MALTNDRKPLAKTIKIKSSTLISKYRKDNKHCELCLLDGLLDAYHLETHHILPGINRTDEIWNIMRLCRKCHDSATIHIHGETAKRVNHKCFAIKYLKNEITSEKLESLGVDIEVWEYIHAIDGVKNEFN